MRVFFFASGGLSLVICDRFEVILLFHETKGHYFWDRKLHAVEPQ